MEWLRVAAVSGFLGVAIGAFGAHGLKERLEAHGRVATFETGVHYHLFHVAALLALGLLSRQAGSSTALTVSGWSFSLGILIFSGSLYALALTNLRWLGAITPLGGLLFLAGWAALFLAVRR